MSASTAALTAPPAACPGKFGDWRVLDTPISEATIGGAAVGAAMAGMRPIAEIMYVDFTPLAMDQVANVGAKNRYMFGGKTAVPMVIRTEGGAGGPSPRITAKASRRCGRTSPASTW